MVRVQPEILILVSCSLAMHVAGLFLHPNDSAEPSSRGSVAAVLVALVTAAGGRSLRASIVTSGIAPGCAVLEAWLACQLFRPRDVGRHVSVHQEPGRQPPTRWDRGGRGRVRLP